MRGFDVAGVGVLTGWGEGVASLPDDACVACAGRDVIPLAVPELRGDRFRRATRECRLAIAAVEALLRETGLGRETIAGSDTALVYVTAAAYGASNAAFLDEASTGRALHFPYTAPSAVPAEVAIEFGLTGAYVILIGGAAATIDALWQAASLVGRGGAERALVLAVETFAECVELWKRARRLIAPPLTEAAACALIVPGAAVPVYHGARATRQREREARRRAGETLACEPLIALALDGTHGAAHAVEGEWRGRRAALSWPPSTRS